MDTKIILKYLFIFIPTNILFYFNYKIVKLTFNTKIINITLKGKTKNIVEAYPTFVTVLKYSYLIFTYIALFICFLAVTNFIILHLPNRKKNKTPKDIYPKKIKHSQDSDEIIIGVKHNDKDLRITDNPKVIKIPFKNLYKNLVVLGTIGEGKTSSVLYNAAQQLIYYKAWEFDNKIGIFATDVKGNFSKQIVKYAKDVGRDDDIILFRIGGDFFFNPLHKPNESAQVITSRILEPIRIQSKNGNEAYWLDQAQMAIEQAINLARLINNGYVTFIELDRIMSLNNEREKIIKELENKKISGLLSKYEVEIFDTAKNYFENNFTNLSDNVKSIIVSEVDRITKKFVSDPIVKRTFCPPKEKLNLDFRKIIEEGKIVIFDVPSEKFKIVFDLAVTFGKLEFQAEVLKRMSEKNYNKTRNVAFISDENHFIITENDLDFYSIAREARVFNIIASQDMSSYLDKLKTEAKLNSLFNKLDNKIFMRNTDKRTINYCLDIINKETKKFVRKSYSESGKAKIDYYNTKIEQEHKGFAQTISEDERRDFVFDKEFFSRQLEEFKGLCFINGGKDVFPIHFFKYWENRLYKDVKLKKAILKNEFIYDDYPTLSELIEKINKEDSKKDKFNNSSSSNVGSPLIKDVSKAKYKDVNKNKNTTKDKKTSPLKNEQEPNNISKTNKNVNDKAVDELINVFD